LNNTRHLFIQHAWNMRVRVAMSRETAFLSFLLQFFQPAFASA